MYIIKSDNLLKILVKFWLMKILKNTLISALLIFFKFLLLAIYI